ncbi:MAG: SH3 domain-containing protein [Treponema sp.]|nr:SH3 domain-containing protein [Treponema sp.]
MDVYIYKYIYLDVKTYKVLGLVDESEQLYIDFDDLIFKDSSTYLPEEIFKGKWIHSYYFDALKAKNPKVILQNEPWWDEKNGWKPDPYGEYPLSWGEEFQYNYGSYYFTKFTFCNGKIYYFIDKIQKKDKYYYITSKRRITTEYDDETRKEYLKSSDYKKIQNYSEIDLIISLDGDYMDIYLNSTDNHLGTYCFADSETVRQLWFFARDIDSLPVDFDNVRYPRHADGSCDYDGSKKTAAVQTAKETPSPNVAQNKTMSVTENLKLRSGEATSTQVLTVMAAGTKVKILQTGKKETIDGITSNWVKVEVLADATDRDGKPIKAGTVGWCYGGYLKLIEEPKADKPANKKDEKKKKKK